MRVAFRLWLCRQHVSAHVSGPLRHRNSGGFRQRARTVRLMARLLGVHQYSSFQALLDDNVTLVLKLTNPRAHYETTRALLEAGKHVYTEKPLATRLDHARALVALAERRDLLLASAPCTLLNPVAQTVWKRLREDLIGPVRLVYAEMEDGMVPRAPTAKWINEAGIGWPRWTSSSPAARWSMRATYSVGFVRFSARPKACVPTVISCSRKRSRGSTSVAARLLGRLHSVRSGVVARMTNGIYAAHDHRIAFFGDEGTLTVDDPRTTGPPFANGTTVRRVDVALLARLAVYVCSGQGNASPSIEAVRAEISGAESRTWPWRSRRAARLILARAWRSTLPN